MQQKDGAPQKAADLIRMGVAKAAQLEPLQENELSITRGALVIGGGIAGMSAATSMSRMGLKSILVEKQDRLGGMLNDVGYPGSRRSVGRGRGGREDGRGKGHSGIEVRTSST